MVAETFPRLQHRAALALLCGLGLPAAAQVDITDDSGHRLVLKGPAQRIVSLAPHVTEILFAAGAGDKVVGVVAYSDYPEAARKLPQVGGYTQIDLEAIAALRPDLVIGWPSGNRSAPLEHLRALGIPVYLNEPRSLDAVAHSLEQFGRLAGSEAPAQAAATAFRERRAALAARYRERPAVRTFYQIWDRPLMTVNDEHLIADVIRLCGGRNVFGQLSQLAPTIGVEAVLAADPEAIVASGMGEGRPEWLDQWKRWPQLEATRRDNLFFIPPERIQRHTPRILDGAQLLCEQLEQARARRGAISPAAPSGGA
ncbi:cobalamin-binding protein [Thauera chlorobenzoica]|uniref:Periplasmic B12-binding protein BtuF n=1 Tax=Thauera chlorobenzoica TaxID=96773 RepID=A0A1H5W2C3_9RHOO|nr:cobalamin-binding protein [Thauera chlorobenzoica]APR03337.1 periplasmic B12-binding protein BtuF [Thauera chlorobenzoica]SEF93448.1 iron complex transport system substrate-binding protein [Thauera chlorobenzoica]